MSGIVGKKNNTLRKEQVTESKLSSKGTKNLVFAHKASLGETAIPFGALNTPTEMTANGFVQPSSGDILSANLRAFKENVQVESSLNGLLIQHLTYVVTSGAINFVNGYEASQDEIFRVTMIEKQVTDSRIVDVGSLVATGVLSAGDQDFNVGQLFKVEESINAQIGAVLVFKEGVIQFRNVSNVTADPGADGNYEELASSGGYGNVIRFNVTEGVDTNIIVVSLNGLKEKPELSQLQEIENIATQLDVIIPYIEDLAGLTPGTLQPSGPTNQDLKSFGDSVIDHENRVSALEAFPTVAAGNYSPALTIVSNLDAVTLQGTFNFLRVGNIVTVSGVLGVDPTAVGFYDFEISLPIASNVNGVAGSIAGAGNRSGSEAVRVLQSSTADRANANGSATSTSNSTTTVHFTYEIL